MKNHDRLLTLFKKHLLFLFVFTSLVNADMAYWDRLDFTDLPIENRSKNHEQATIDTSKNISLRLEVEMNSLSLEISNHSLSQKTPPNTPQKSQSRSAHPLPIKAQSLAIYQKVVQNIPEHLLIRSLDTFNAIRHQKHYLRYARKEPQLRDQSLLLNNQKLLKTLEMIESWLNNNRQEPLAALFDLYQIISPNNAGKVRFTGYYTEKLSARKHATTEYRYPIYAYPKFLKKLPSRQEIAEGALQNKQLELAWVSDRITLYFMQIQGSGMLEFDDGSTKLLTFGGKNKYPYRSLGRYMADKGYLPSGVITNHLIRKWLEKHPKQTQALFNRNASYVFFKESGEKVMTAARVPAIAKHTISVDSDYIPFGSVLLAKVPLKDFKGKLTGYDWRLLFPQDHGSAVNGSSHIDLYMGAGKEASELSDGLSLDGVVYLLLKK